MATVGNAPEKEEQGAQNQYFYHYPIGNCPPTDVTLHCKIPTPCDVLLPGCGDIRFLLFTVDSIHKLLPPSSTNQVLNFHLNDIESGILGRALILLYLAENIDPNLEEDVKFLWAVWYDVLLSKEHHQRLCDVMQRLETWVSGEHGIYFGTDLTRRKLVLALQWWQQYRVDAQRQVQLRTNFFTWFYADTNNQAKPVERQAERFLLNHSIFKGNTKLQDRVQQEIKEYVDYGVTRINSKGKTKDSIMKSFVGNPTMYRPYLDAWRTLDSCSPFLCYNVDFMLDRYNGSTVTMSSLFLEQLKNWVVSYQTFKQTCGEIKIHLWLGDVVALLESGLPEGQTFDFIHTSNLSDRIGIIPLLVQCQEKLRKQTGVLTIQLFHYANLYVNLEGLLMTAVGIPLNMYPTILGLQLAEDIYIGHECVPEDGDFTGNARLTLTWKKAREPCMMHLTGSDGISQALTAVFATPDRLLEHISRLDMHTKVKLTRRLLQYVNNVAEEQTSDSDKEMDRVLCINYSSVQQKVTEYPDRYEVSLTCPPDQMVGAFTRDYQDGSLFTVVFTFSENSRVNMTTSVSFTCAVLLKESKMEFSRKKGTITGKIYKDVENTHGSHVLPGEVITKCSMQSLQDLPRNKFTQEDLDLQCYKIFPVDEYANPFPIPVVHPYHQLAGLVHQCMNLVWALKHTSVHIEGSGGTWNLLLVVDGFKIFEGKPTMFVTWYNLHKARRLLHADVAPSEVDGVVKAHRNSIPVLVGPNMMEGVAFLWCILSVNSYNLDQSGLENPKWTLKTYLRPRYTYGPYPQFRIAAEGMVKSGPYPISGGYKEIFEWIKSFNNQTGGSLPAEECARIATLQTELVHSASVNSPTGSSSATSDHEQDSSLQERSNCFNCSTVSICKSCARCDTAKYCDKKCQREHWPVHKHLCRPAKD